MINLLILCFKEKYNIPSINPNKDEREKVHDDKFAKKNEESEESETCLKRTITPYFQASNFAKERPSFAGQKTFDDKELKTEKDKKQNEDSRTEVSCKPKTTIEPSVEKEKHSKDSETKSHADVANSRMRNSLNTKVKNVACKNILKIMDRTKQKENPKVIINGLNEAPSNLHHPKAKKESNTSIFLCGLENPSPLNANWGNFYFMFRYKYYRTKM